MAFFWFCFCFFGHSKNVMADKTSHSTEQRKQETAMVLNVAEGALVGAEPLAERVSVIVFIK